MKCPKCGSTKVWRYGWTPTKAGRKIRYKCTECASSFYDKKSNVKAKRGAGGKFVKAVEAEKQEAENEN